MIGFAKSTHGQSEIISARTQNFSGNRRGSLRIMMSRERPQYSRQRFIELLPS
jgi:hypothetical protein